MKKIFFIVLATIVIVGCGGLVSVGDSNTNTINHTNNLNKKDEK